MNEKREKEKADYEEKEAEGLDRIEKKQVKRKDRIL